LKEKKSTLGILFLVILLILQVGCGGKTIESRWNDSNITIDGNGEEWPGYSLQYSQKDDLEIVYGIANDQNNLKLMFRFHDYQLARTLNARGITIWFDEKNKKDRHYGIRYIDPDAFDDAFAQLEEFKQMREKGDFPGLMNRSVSLTGEFFFIKNDTTIIPPGGLNGIEAMAAQQKSGYCYEFKIPLNGEENSINFFGTQTGQKIKIGFEIPDVGKEVRKELRDQMDAIRNSVPERSGQTGGMPDDGNFGGMRGEGPGFMPDDPGMAGMPDFDAKEMWLTVLLANAPTN
jgi:hypothetical protein